MPPHLSHRPRIVVIDDDRTHVRQMRQALEQAGYEPRTGSAWKLAPLFVAEAQPVLVILQSAPGSERRGWRVLDEMKQAKETQSIPVLICSSAAPALDTLRRILHGCGVQVLPLQPSARQLLGCGRRTRLASCRRARARLANQLDASSTATQRSLDVSARTVRRSMGPTSPPERCLSRPSHASRRAA